MTCKIVANSIKGKRREQIQRAFMVMNKYTPEEEEKALTTTTMQTRAVADRKRKLDASSTTTTTTPAKAKAVAAFDVFLAKEMQIIFECVMRVNNNDLAVLYALSQV